MPRSPACVWPVEPIKVPAGGRPSTYSCHKAIPKTRGSNIRVRNEAIAKRGQGIKARSFRIRPLGKGAKRNGRSGANAPRFSRPVVSPIVSQVVSRP